MAHVQNQELIQTCSNEMRTYTNWETAEGASTPAEPSQVEEGSEGAGVRGRSPKQDEKEKMWFWEPQHSAKALSAVWWLWTHVARGPIPVARYLFIGRHLAKIYVINILLIGSFKLFWCLDCFEFSGRPVLQINCFNFTLQYTLLSGQRLLTASLWDNTKPVPLKQIVCLGSSQHRYAVGSTEL